MSAPKCKICTKQHYGQCDPKDLPDLPQQSSSVKKAEPIENDSQQSLSETSPTVKQQETQAKREWRKRNRDHYNDYMREYMRRRREGL